MPTPPRLPPSLEHRLVRFACGLSPRVQRRLFGAPARVDGQELAPDIHVVIRLAEFAGSDSFTGGMPPAEARAHARLEAEIIAARPQIPMARVEELMLPGPAGPVAARLYVPHAAEAPAPLLVYYHGGGWVIGDLDTHDVVCRQIASLAQAVVIAVDYRLAPEHRFPAAADDAWSATTWIASHATELGLDPTRIAVGGDSAGGGLAALVSILARDSRKLRLALQVLVYPVLDLRAQSESYSKYAEGYLLTRAAMRWYIAQYAPTPDSITDWRASPLLAPWVHGVAPAVIIAAELDPLFDEGEAYARRLQGARVPVQHHRIDGMVHGFLTMGGKVDAANRAVESIATALRGAFTRQS
jgi:acetyl esterase